MWVLSAPWRMANAVLRENAVPATVYFSRALTFSSYAAPGALVSEIVAALASGDVRAGDWLIFQQAGPHGSDPDAHQLAAEAVLEAASAPGVHRAVMTMFDYAADPASQYDTVFGSRTINEATVAAAAATDTPVLDANALMDAYRAATLAADGLSPMHGDGIHANVWGQMKLTGAILDFVGLAGDIQTFESLSAVAAANHAALGYGSGTWSAEKAAAYCDAIRG
jgi:hypothetical protein